MSRKSNRYKRRAEMETRRADAAVRRTRQDVLDILHSRRSVKVTVYGPNTSVIVEHAILEVDQRRGEVSVRVGPPQSPVML